MEIQKIYPVTQYMLLGRCGDNNVKQIWINVRQWLQEVPSGQFQLMIYPPQGDVYPAPTVLEDGILKWTITDADTAIVGDGQAQLTMYGADGEVERQKTIGTRVLESKAGRESGEIPDHITPWVDTISTMSTQAKRAAAQAKASQSIVQEYSQQAQAAVDDAVAAKNSAEASKVAAESARDSAQNYVADAQAAKATAQAAASEAQDAKYAAQSAKTLAEGAKSQAIGAKLEAQYAQQHAVAAKDAAVQAQLSAQGYATTAQTAASSANTANSQAQSAKTDAVQAKQAAQEALQQLKDGIRTGDFKGEKGDTPVITSERSGNVTTIRSDGVAVAQILDGQDGGAGFSPSVSVTKNNKVTTIRITDKDGVHTATINDGEDGSDATVTKQSIEAALSYVPANDATAMIYKQVIFDGTKFTDDAGTQLTFSQLKTLCLDHKHFVYCTYENDLYIPQHVQPTQIYFDATYIRNHQVEIHRVGINLNGSVNQQVVYPQEKLVSGTNIKTINNESILGSGDIHIVGGGDIVQNPDDEYEGIVVPSTLADVDPTLTAHGDAADAGVVGQQIAQIKEDYLALERDALKGAVDLSRGQEIPRGGGSVSKFRKYTEFTLESYVTQYNITDANMVYRDIILIMTVPDTSAESANGRIQLYGFNKGGSNGIKIFQDSAPWIPRNTNAKTVIIQSVVIDDVIRVTDAGAVNTADYPATVYKTYPSSHVFDLWKLRIYISNIPAGTSFQIWIR